VRSARAPSKMKLVRWVSVKGSVNKLNLDQREFKLTFDLLLQVLDCPRIWQVQARSPRAEALICASQWRDCLAKG